MRAWFDFPSIWTTTTSQKTEYINYDTLYYNYIQEAKDVQDFASISTAEANGLFNCFYPIEITTPIKKHGVKMG